MYLYCLKREKFLGYHPSHFTAYEKVYQDYIMFVSPYRIQYLFNKKQARYCLSNNESDGEIVIDNIEFDIAVKLASRLNKLKAFL